MNQGFSVSFLSVAFILLLSAFVSYPFFGCGTPFEFPITKNPDEFRYIESDPVIHIKADGSRFFEHELLPEDKLNDYQGQIQEADRIFLSADARLNFGVVRKALLDLSGYRRREIVLESEKLWIEGKLTPFQEYLMERSNCGCNF